MSEGATAESAVARLVGAAGVRRIVFIDDAFAAGLETLQETLAGFTPAQRAEATSLDLHLMEVADVWQQAVRDQWDQLDNTERASLVDKAYAIAGDARPVPAGAMHALRSLLPDMETEGLSLADWQARRDELLDSINETPTLILFDQDFHHESAGTQDGQRLISELQAALVERGEAWLDNAYYGLLTNTVEVDQEHTRRDEILAAGGLDAARFVLISKQNLADEELRRFASRLRTILLAPLFVDLLGAVTDEVRTTQDEAFDQVRSIPPEDLEHMVVRTSVREGVWEPDTLLRILEAMQRAKARERLRKADRVNTLTQRLREIAAIDPAEGAVPLDAEAEIANHSEHATVDPAGLGDQTARARGDEPTPVPVPVAVRISHQEIYDSGEHVNGLHLPIEVGDLLTRESGKRYVVVAQPCDLMVRSGGARAPDLTHMLVAELTSDAAPGPELFAEFKLPYFKERSGADGLVRLARPTFVRALILDSCVLNSDGTARLDMKGTPPQALLPNWHARHERLQKVGAAIFARLAKLQGKVADEIGVAMTGHFKGDIFAPKTIDADKQVIVWDCQRVGRIGDPYARALLTRYSQYFSRDAYLHDLARR